MNAYPMEYKSMMTITLMKIEAVSQFVMHVTFDHHSDVQV